MVWLHGWGSGRRCGLELVVLALRSGVTYPQRRVPHSFWGKRAERVRQLYEWRAEKWSPLKIKGEGVTWLPAWGAG